MKHFKLLLSLLLVFAFVGPSFASAATTKNVPITHRTVESFVTNVIDEGQDGQLVLTGSKKVNSITQITEDTNTIKTKITALEDYYDLNGQYINSKLKVEEFSNDYLTGKADYTVQEKDFDTPQTGNTDNSSQQKLLSKEAMSENLTSSEETIVGNKLESLVASTKDFKVTNKKVNGITQKQMNELKQLANKLKKNKAVDIKDGHLSVNKEAFNKVLSEQIDSSQVSLAATSMEMAGAFDNYYNHDTSTGKFTVQALSASPHKYVKMTGTTSGNSLNASSMTKFKSAINNYERYVIDQMNAKAWPEVAGWFGVLMGLASIVYGFVGGPAGWVEICLYYGGALSTFAGLTSSVYATYSRLSLSQNASYYCQQARDLLYYKNWSGISATVVSGF